VASIRNSAKAVVVRDGRLLVTINQDRDGTFYLLPGGGQERGETLAQALVRECLEETGIHVGVGDLLFAREYLSAHHEFAAYESDEHQIEFMFACRAGATEEPRSERLADSWQVGAAFVPLDQLTELRFYPAALKDPLVKWARGSGDLPCYLGDIN